MKKIQHLLNVADDPNTTPEAAANYRETAERMMAKYAIDEARLAAGRILKGETDKPVTKRFEFAEAADPLLNQYYALFMAVVDHNRCQAVGFTSGYGYIIGFPGDITFVEMMYMSLRLQMSAKVNPEPDVTRSFDWNVYRLQQSGVKWESIAYLMKKAKATAPVGSRAEGWMEIDWHPTKKDGGRLIRAAKRYCKHNSLEYSAVQTPDSFRRSYAQGFLQMVGSRLEAMRAHQRDEIRSETGAELVLVGRKDRVTAEMELFKRANGVKDKKGKAPGWNVVGDAWRRGAADGKSADLSSSRNNVGGNTQKGIGGS